MRCRVGPGGHARPRDTGSGPAAGGDQLRLQVGEILSLLGGSRPSSIDHQASGVPRPAEETVDLLGRACLQLPRTVLLPAPDREQDYR